MKRFLICLLLFFPFLAIAEGSADGHVDFGPLPQPIRDSILDGLRKNKVVEIDETPQAVDPAQARVWLGNDPVISAVVQRALLKWSRPVSEVDGKKADGQSFYLHLEFADDTISVKSSRSGLTAPEGGLVLKGGEKKIVPLSVVGEGELRMVVLSPRIRGGATQAVLFCPRVYGPPPPPIKTEHGTTPSPLYTTGLFDSGFRIVESKVEVSGSVSGKIKASLGAAYAAADLLTSSDLPRSVEYHDRTTSREPSMSLNYLPFKGEVSTPAGGEDSNLTPLGDRASGIRGTLELINSAGFRRESSLQDVLWITSISFPPENPIKIGGADQGQGDCYALVRHRSKTEIYTKESPPTVGTGKK